MKNFIAAVSSTLLFLSYSNSNLHAESKPKEPLTLLGMLSEWQYPDSKFKGASSSDAAVKDISSIKSQAALTTTDSAEKVLNHYLKQLNVDAEGKNLDEKDNERVTTDRAITVLNNSQERDVQVHIISVVEEDISTTLVISRGKDEDTTHIAWTQFRKLWP